MSIHVGIGSWTDKEYVGVLYPKGVPDKQRLSAYAAVFEHVEINSTYHAIQRAEVVAGWAAQTPPEFRFEYKLPRAFSDNPAAAAASEDLVSRVARSAEPLARAKKLAAFLLVLPPSFGPKRDRLEELDLVAEKFRPHVVAVELRDRGWVEGEQRARTLEYFRARQLAWVAVDMPRVENSTIMPPVDEVTHPKLAYLRLHGRNSDWFKLRKAEEKHHYDYPEAELAEIVTRIKTLAAQAEQVIVVANNHASDFAPRAALTLKKLLGQPVPRPESATQETLPFD